jgi:hypothetical protein
MMYAKVIDGQVVQIGLPTTGTLSDGRSVSNYNLLPEAVLLAEGWLPYQENKPEYNPETQYLQLSGYDIQQDKVIANYEAVLIIHIPTVEERLEAAEFVIMDMLETMMLME